MTSLNVKRIGIDAHMLGDHSGGNETFYIGILSHMQIPKNMEIILFVMPNVDVEILREKFKIVVFKCKNAFARNFFELPYLCKKYKLSLIHTQYFIPFWCCCPIVCTIHDICFEHFRNIFTKKEYFRQKILIPYAAKHSNSIITVSESSKKDIANTYKIDERKIHVVYNAAKKVFFQRENLTSIPDIKEKFGITKKYVLSVGNLQPRKNLVRLIKAFTSLKRGQFDYQLVIVGKKAWMFNEIFKTAQSSFADILFTDYVTDEELALLYRNALCFIYPSFFEGFGLPPLEAMSSGVPVAVSKASCLPEIVGDASLFFDPFDENDIAEKIKCLTENEKIRENLVKKGYDRAEYFNWSASARKVVEVYECI